MGGSWRKRGRAVKTLQQRNDNIFAKLHCCHSETNLKVTKTILKKFPTAQQSEQRPGRENVEQREERELWPRGC